LQDWSSRLSVRHDDRDLVHHFNHQQFPLIHGTVTLLAFHVTCNKNTIQLKALNFQLSHLNSLGYKLQTDNASVPMGTYRLEVASSGRAGCQNKECKDEKIKIDKGDLRLGTWVDNEKFQSFFWRHWGCVTPKIIASLIEISEETSDGNRDYTLLDGYDDLSSEHQSKVREALEQGHVADSEWRGDQELNRPGKTGFRKRATKTKGPADNDDADEKKADKAKSAKSAKSKAENPKAKKSEIEKSKVGNQKTEKPNAKKRAHSNKNDDEPVDDADSPSAKKPKKESTGKKTASNPPDSSAKAKKARTDLAEAEPTEDKPKRDRKKAKSDTVENTKEKTKRSRK
jgi:hypothetical protein